MNKLESLFTDEVEGTVKDAAAVYLYF